MKQENESCYFRRVTPARGFCSGFNFNSLCVTHLEPLENVTCHHGARSVKPSLGRDRQHGCMASKTHNIEVKGNHLQGIIEALKCWYELRPKGCA